MELARRVLVVCEELHHALLGSGLHLVGAALAGNLKVDTVRRLRVDTAHLPRAGVSDTALGLANGNGLLVVRDSVTDQTGDLQLLRGENLEVGVESHEQVVLVVLVEDAHERLLVHGRCKAIRQNHVSTGAVRKAAHLEQTDLVKTTSEDINDVAVLRHALGEVLVKLLHVSAGLINLSYLPTFSAFL